MSNTPDRYEECRNRAEQIILKWWMMGGNTVPMPPISDPLATLADLIAKELERFRVES